MDLAPRLSTLLASLQIGRASGMMLNWSCNRARLSLVVVPVAKLTCLGLFVFLFFLKLSFDKGIVLVVVLVVMLGVLVELLVLGKKGD